MHLLVCKYTKALNAEYEGLFGEIKKAPKKIISIFAMSMVALIALITVMSFITSPDGIGIGIEMSLGMTALVFSIFFASIYCVGGYTYMESRMRSTFSTYTHGVVRVNSSGGRSSYSGSSGGFSGGSSSGGGGRRRWRRKFLLKSKNLIKDGLKKEVHPFV